MNNRLYTEDTQGSLSPTAGYLVTQPRQVDSLFLSTTVGAIGGGEKIPPLISSRFCSEISSSKVISCDIFTPYENIYFYFATLEKYVLPYPSFFNSSKG